MGRRLQGKKKQTPMVSVDGKCRHFGNLHQRCILENTVGRTDNRRIVNQILMGLGTVKTIVQCRFDKKCRLYTKISCNPAPCSGDNSLESFCDRVNIRRSTLLFIQSKYTIISASAGQSLRNPASTVTAATFYRLQTQPYL